MVGQVASGRGIQRPPRAQGWGEGYVLTAGRNAQIGCGRGAAVSDLPRTVSRQRPRDRSLMMELKQEWRHWSGAPGRVDHALDGPHRGSPDRAHGAHVLGADPRRLHQTKATAPAAGTPTHALTSALRTRSR